MGSDISRQRERSRETSNVFFVGSDGQLVEGEVHGLPGPVLLTPAAHAFFRKMEKAYAELERGRQRREAMRRAGALNKWLPKASPSKPRARF